MRELWSIAWHRFNIISSVVGDSVSRIISTLFYFTILAPFGIGSRLFTDPMRQKTTTGADGKPKHVGQEWAAREPVSTDLNDARRQG